MRKAVDNVDNVCKTFSFVFTKKSIYIFREEKRALKLNLSTELPNNSHLAVDKAVDDADGLAGKRCATHNKNARFDATTHCRSIGRLHAPTKRLTSAPSYARPRF
ncbi:hypothetical protein PA598K_05800 [Paenibacillus sp. 598K]|uniref:hypothetical protein n=1 Tax=Paenibacillus sp. 598K TaxID=1117987 RepID=UPI000FF92811|nr:hypothetical protein [Paenibacillus sp. 598K]GBF77264.1 hypothetical protein PA598K_05800 [Paenibacillus sp. 598K]